VIADKAGIPKRIATAAVKEAVSVAQTHWPDLLKTMDASQAVRDVITERLANLPLAKVGEPGRRRRDARDAPPQLTNASF
jgi:serine/threonine-protein kinase HipA